MQLSWAGYSTFIGFVLLLTIAPGPDFAVVMKNALAAGRTAGLWTTVGINISNAAQGTVAALGLGAVIVASRPVFETIRWAGIVYLCWLGFHTLRSARRGPGGAPDAPSPPSTGSWRRRLLQGALSNITNPKILVFYLSVLPQFLPAHASLLDALVLANTLPVIGFCWLVLDVSGVHTLRRVDHPPARAPQPRRPHRHRTSRLNGWCSRCPIPRRPADGIDLRWAQHAVQAAEVG